MRVLTIHVNSLSPKEKGNLEFCIPKLNPNGHGRIDGVPSFGRSFRIGSVYFSFPIFCIFPILCLNLSWVCRNELRDDTDLSLVGSLRVNLFSY